MHQITLESAALVLGLILPGTHSPDPASAALAVLKTHCAGCHGTSGTGKGGFDFVLDRDRLVARRQILPGKPDESPLYLRLRDGEMPPPGAKPPPVKAQESALLKHWIEIGAPSDRASPPPTRIGPAEVNHLVLADLDRLEPRQRRFTRYLVLTPQSNAGARPEQMDGLRHAIVKLLNSLSWHPRLTAPEPTDAARSIYRLDLRDYRWNARQWDRLAAASPYRVPGSAVDRTFLERSGTETPWLRGDWFVANASSPPFYYDFLQLPKTDRGLERMLQVDVAENLRDDLAIRAGFNGSGVARNNRLLERHDAAFGAYWRSYDFSDNTGRQNLFQHPLGPTPAPNAFQHAGGESIFHLPNRLHAYMLLDAEGRRVDKAPGDIVSDPKRPDRLVEAGISCFSCHAAGLLPKDDQVRAHVLKNPNVFAAPDRAAILALYVSAARFRRLLDGDNQRFRRALQKIGVPEAEPEPIVAVTLAYEGMLDLRSAAAEVGLSTQEFSARLRGHADLARALGPLLAPGGTVQRQLFETNFAEIARSFRLGDGAVPVAVKQSRPFIGHTGSVTALTISRDGRLAASGGEDGTIHVWDAAGGVEQMHFDAHREAVHALAFTPDNKHIIAGGADRVLRIWDAGTGRELRRFSGHTATVRTVVVSPDGRILVSGGDDATVRVSDLNTGRETASWAGHTGRVLALAFSPDGRLVASAGEDRLIHLWDPETGKSKGNWEGHTGAVQSLAFAADGRSLASGSEDRTARLWDVHRGTEVRRLIGHANPILRVAFAPSGKVLTASSQYRTPDRVLRLWDAANGGEVMGVGWENLSPDVRVECVTFAPDGAWALISHGVGELKRWRLPTESGARATPGLPSTTTGVKP